MHNRNHKLQNAIGKMSNLALPELGASIFSVSDDFFAPAKRMLSAEEPVFIPDLYDAHGKWMDGWESRRKRSKGHDDCVIRICPGVVKAIEIDTRFFTGNYAPAAMIEACDSAIEPDENTQWHELVAKTELKGDSRQLFEVKNEDAWNFIRLNIYPDGGIARLRVFGEPTMGAFAVDRYLWVDLASSDVGGVALACNDMHYGDMHNLLSNLPVANMGNGWETRRRRTPGNDWVILKLGHKGTVRRVEVDTAFFRGNYPARCSLKGGTPDTHADLAVESGNWKDILPQVALGPDQVHIFENQVQDAGDVTHVRLDIYPDGGVARLRLSGLPEDAELSD